MMKWIEETWWWEDYIRGCTWAWDTHNNTNEVLKALQVFDCKMNGLIITTITYPEELESMGGSCYY